MKLLILLKRRIIFTQILALTLFLTITSLSQAQNQKVKLSGNNITLSMAFDQIEKQTNLSVDYDAKTVNVKKVLRALPKGTTLNEVMTQLLQGTGYTYVISGSHVIISVSNITKQTAVDVNQQQGKTSRVTGMVTDEKGETLIGVTIMEDGTKNGTTTDVKGEFSITVRSALASLNFSYLGYMPTKVQVNNQNKLKVQLQPDLRTLGEVVVTALGIKREAKALSYNVQNINASEIFTIKDVNLVNSLAGKVAGVTINASSTGIGGSARVVMRGTKSIAGNNNALYVVDGIPLPSLSSNQSNDIFTGMGQSGDGVSTFNSDDIESMSILSGPAAAALYGSDAANGVIMITTKKGQKDNFSVDVTNSTSFYSPFVLPKFQNTYGSVSGSYYSWGEKLTTPSTYNPKDYFQTGYNVNNSVSISTGNEKNQTYLSSSSSNAAGIIHNNTLGRYNFSIRNTSSFLKDKLTLDLSAMYINIREQNMLAQGQYFNPLIPIYTFPRGDEIVKYQTYERYDATRNFKVQYWPYGDLGLQMQNPYWITERDLFINNKNRYMMNGALKYTVNDWINVTGRAKLDYNTVVGERDYYASTSGLFANPPGAYNKNNISTRQIYTDFMVNISKYIKDFSITSTIGASMQDVVYDNSGIGGDLQSVPNLFTFSNLNLSQAEVTQNDYHDQSQAVFATAQVGYKSKAYLDVTARNDWVSALAKTNTKSIFYPSIGFSGILTDLFRIKSKTLNFMKARVSYSEVGNAPQRFISEASYPVISGYPQITTYLPASGLQPERTKSYEAGLNAVLFNNKVKLDVTLYKSSTYNQLFNPTLSASSGYSSFYVNSGQIDNKGIELSLGFNQKIGKLEWTSNVVYSLNQNKIVKLLPSFVTPTGETISMSQLNMGGTSSTRMMLVEGGSMGDLYVNKLKTDEHGYISVNLASQSVTSDPNNFIKAGNANPKYNVGFRNNFTFKGLSLGFLISARVGGIGVSATQAILDAYGVSQASADARDNGGALVNGFKIPAQSYYQTIGGGTSGVGSMYVYDATNVRLAEMSLGYEIPITKVCKWLKGLNASIVGRNLYMFYNKAPFDPESTSSTGTYYQGIDYFMQPSLRSIGFSIKARF